MGGDGEVLAVCAPNSRTRRPAPPKLLTRATVEAADAGVEGGIEEGVPLPRGLLPKGIFAAKRDASNNIARLRRHRGPPVALQWVQRS